MSQEYTDFQSRVMSGWIYVLLIIAAIIGTELLMVQLAFEAVNLCFFQGSLTPSDYWQWHAGARPEAQALIRIIAYIFTAIVLTLLWWAGTAVRSRIPRLAY